MTDKDILIQQLFEQIQLLQAENAVLREEIARLKKNSSNSSKPPSSDIINPRIDLKSKRKRKPGGQNGHSKFTREPFAPQQIDKTIIHKLSTEEIQRRNLIVLNETQTALQQIDLPDKFYKVVEHRVQLYQTPDGKITTAKLPKDIRAEGLFATRMAAFTGYMKSRCHMSYSTIEAFFSDIMNIVQQQ